ncbi:hypothetical protein TVAGG3_0128480 [Trichomonas vaginalis G3]|uniref:hypothetical protein n=1 Tax=Trichomonas vaginalis (strain ATCC PRA-98 / G3) TaxID=412133 RepID=UPI0021E5977C|nr:hypothetical protein TVAGG3_0128480 [Trichomonas vaginalis G3]KAI5545933.1 hypothetical protein TVAGG3_0128480 [Trichomonas vaginalis G3]
MLNRYLEEQEITQSNGSTPLNSAQQQLRPSNGTSPLSSAQQQLRPSNGTSSLSSAQQLNPQATPSNQSSGTYNQIAPNPISSDQSSQRANPPNPQSRPHDQFVDIPLSCGRPKQPVPDDLMQAILNLFEQHGRHGIIPTYLRLNKDIAFAHDMNKILFE